MTDDLITREDCDYNTAAYIWERRKKPPADTRGSTTDTARVDLCFELLLPVEVEYQKDAFNAYFNSSKQRRPVPKHPVGLPTHANVAQMATSVC